MCVLRDLFAVKSHPIKTHTHTPLYFYLCEDFSGTGKLTAALLSVARADLVTSVSSLTRATVVRRPFDLH